MKATSQTRLRACFSHFSRQSDRSNPASMLGNQQTKQLDNVDMQAQQNHSGIVNIGSRIQEVSSVVGHQSGTSQTELVAIQFFLRARYYHYYYHLVLG